MKRTPVTSTSEQVRIMAAAGKEILPPAHVPLQKCDMPFFDSVIAEYAKADWSDHQLEMAAMMARMMSDMESEQRALREEGAIVKTDKGTPVVNPRKTVVQMLAGSIFAMRRSLALHARAASPTTPNKDLAKTKALSKMIEQNSMMETEGEDLLARPLN